VSSPTVTIELAGIPPAKGRPRFTRGGIAYTPAKTRANEAALRFAAQEAMSGRPPLEGALAISITATFPVPVSWPKHKRHAALMGEHHHTRRPDTDNLLKTIDALNQVCWRDDAQIVRAEIIKLYGTRPRLTIEIKQIQNFRSRGITEPERRQNDERSNQS
jgi:Holliday junction resolvase RusA-like endonuclease